MNGIGLTTLQLARLDDACRIVRRGLNSTPYLVGSAERSTNFRDVDVRVIMDDEVFDEIFGGLPQFWEIVCLSITSYLTQVTDLPIDFQIQRQTEANARFDGPRNSLGGGRRAFAGLGDATNFEADAR